MKELVFDAEDFDRENSSYIFHAQKLTKLLKDEGVFEHTTKIVTERETDIYFRFTMPLGQTPPKSFYMGIPIDRITEMTVGEALFYSGEEVYAKLIIKSIRV